MNKYVALLFVLILGCYLLFSDEPKVAQAIDDESENELSLAPESENKIVNSPERVVPVKPESEKIEMADKIEELRQVESSIQRSKPMKTSSSDKVIKKSISRRKKIIVDHPGRIEELAPGTRHENGQLVGEEEALLHLEHFESDLYAQIQSLDQEVFRTKYAAELHWFQRVGNFRKKQKCNAILKMKKDMGLEPTNFKDCMTQFLDVEKEVWKR